MTYWAGASAARAVCVSAARAAVTRLASSRRQSTARRVSTGGQAASGTRRLGTAGQASSGTRRGTGTFCMAADWSQGVEGAKRASPRRAPALHSDILGHGPVAALAILSLHERGGIGIVGDALVLRIELQLPTHAGGDVAQVAQGA